MCRPIGALGLFAGTLLKKSPFVVTSCRGRCLADYSDGRTSTCTSMFSVYTRDLCVGGFCVRLPCADKALTTASCLWAVDRRFRWFLSGIQPWNWWAFQPHTWAGLGSECYYLRAALFFGANTFRVTSLSVLFLWSIYINTTGTIEKVCFPGTSLIFV